MHCGLLNYDQNMSPLKKCGLRFLTLVDLPDEFDARAVDKREYFTADHTDRREDCHDCIASLVSGNRDTSAIVTLPGYDGKAACNTCHLDGRGSTQTMVGGRAGKRLTSPRCSPAYNREHDSSGVCGPYI